MGIEGKETVFSVNFEQSKAVCLGMISIFYIKVLILGWIAKKDDENGKKV